jgi:hypothetical protein
VTNCAFYPSTTRDENPIVAGREGAIRLSEEVQADGAEFLRVACAHGLEGIIAKHREKHYRSGGNEWWQKITCRRRDSFVIDMSFLLPIASCGNLPGREMGSNRLKRLARRAG